ncbi:MAG: nucleoside recognition domain-containing protein [Gemmataceae bacterium]
MLAPLVALLLKRTLLRGQPPVFVMEMPPYKWPSLRAVLRRMFDSGWAFLQRAGTVILASMVLVWVLLNFPAGDYPARIAALNASVAEEREKADALRESIAPQVREVRRLARLERNASAETLDTYQRQRAAVKDQMAPTLAELEQLERRLGPVDEQVNRLEEEWKRGSYLGQIGRLIEPVVRPLGWDWRIGVAVLASFPAREVVVSTLGIIYQQGRVDTEEIREADYAEVADTGLGKALADARFDDDPARRVFTVPTAVSLMVFFALCCQCASTLAVIRRETRSWTWAAFTFVYMTALAYLAALLVYQVGSLLG